MQNGRMRRISREQEIKRAFREDWRENTEENNLVSGLFWGKVSCKSLKQRDLLILVIFIVHEGMHTHKLYSTFV
jgi:hypothetical protein